MNSSQQHILAADKPPRRSLAIERIFGSLPAVSRAMLWAAAGGLLITILNTILRVLTQQIDVFEVLFFRHVFGLFFLLPFVVRYGRDSYGLRNLPNQLGLGLVHFFALVLLYIALPQISLTDTTVIAFSIPLFVMLGAVWFMGESMRVDRWIATTVGFAGVLIVVTDKWDGQHNLYSLIMLCAAGMFAATLLITKALTFHERPEAIVFWQALFIATLSFPLAQANWQAPTLPQWFGFAAAGFFGTASHYCVTRAFRAADISATQSLRFLDLIWASLLGWLVFSNVPTASTLMGGLVILSATVWISRRESGKMR
jgi:drug/metabolite transporter (DMT)-like permease